MDLTSSQTAALRSIASLRQRIDTANKRLSTGLRVVDTRDSTNVARIAREASVGLAALSKTRASLTLGMASVSSASNAAASIAAALKNVTSLLASAKDPGADLGAIQARLTTTTAGMRSSVASASFQGVNLLASSVGRSFQASAGGQDYSIAVDADLTRMLDSFSGAGILGTGFALSDGSPVAAPSVLGLSGAASATSGRNSTAPSLGGLGGSSSTTAGRDADADAPSTSGISGSASAVAGATGIAPGTSGLSGTTTDVAGTAYRAASAARIAIGTRDTAGYGRGDVENLTVTLDGQTRTISVRQNAVGSRATLKAELQRALDEKFTAGSIVADVDANGVMSLSTGAGSHSISVDSVSISDGDGIATGTLGIQVKTNGYSTTTFTAPNGQSRAYDDIGTPNSTDLDKFDHLEFTIAGKLSGGNTGSIVARVKVSDILDAGAPTSAKLATALNSAISAAGGSSYFGSTVHNGNVVVYHQQSGASIALVSVAGRDGDGDTSRQLGFVRAAGSGTAERAAVRASVLTGTDFAETTVGDGASMRFDISADGVAGTRVTITKATVDAALTGQSDYVVGSGTIADIGKFARVVRQAMSDAGVANATVAADGQRLRFSRTGTPATGDTLSLSGFDATAGTSRVATLTTGSDFAGPTTIASGTSVEFSLAVDGATQDVSVTNADVETALSGRTGRIAGSGAIADATELALVVREAMARSGVAGVSVSSDGARLRFARTTAGAGSLAISDVVGRSDATNAVATTGSDFVSPTTVRDDASLSFDVSLDTGPAVRVAISRATVEAALSDVSGRTPGAGTIASVSELAAVAQRGLVEAGVSGIVVGTRGDRLTFVRTAAGAGSVSVSGVRATASTAVAASVSAGSDFSDPVVVDSDAVVAFDIAVDGAPATRVSIVRSTVEAALGGSTTIADVGDLARVVRRALSEANVAGVDVAAIGRRLAFSKSTAGAGRIEIGGVSARAATSPSDSTTTVSSIDVASVSFRSLDASKRNALIDEYVSNVEAVAARVARAVDHLSFVGGLMASQEAFVGRLQEIKVKAAARTVLIDLDEERVRKAALEARLALVRTTLSIVNQSRSNVLLLFGSRESA